MKKGISFLISMALIIGTFAPIQLHASQPELKKLPDVGEVVAGFKTLERGTMDIVNADTALFEHEKSGTQLIYIQNGDKDRAFDISFKTPAVDNTGANHILEHSAVSGSEKYPLKSIIFSIINQTYSTFANAFTTPNFTSYPVSSMSEDQLLKLMDVYMDCTLNPSIYTDEKVFEREAWRYEKANAEAPLSITGTVYSEMQGALGNIGSAAYYNVMDALFPESVLANISGGDPECIPDLTYERLLEVHRTYYHPSNALIVLYGDLDYEKFLTYLDEAYLSKYDKKEVVIDNGYVQPFKAQVNKDYDYPVAKTTQTAKGAQVDYAYALSNLTTEEVVAMDIVTAVLGHDASTLQKAFKQSGISGNLTVGYNISLPQPILMFSVQNTDATNKEAIKTLIDKSVSQMLEEGFDDEIVDAIIASAEFSNANTTEMSNVGVNISMAVAQNWVARGDFSYIADYNKHLATIKNQGESKYLEDLAKKYIVNNQHAALIATVPKAGLLEENNEKKAAKIQSIEQSMTPEEVQKVMEKTTAFNAWNAKEEDQELVKSLQAVGIAALPVELKAYTIHDETQDGVRYLMAEADVANTINANLLFDTSG
ncbi:MAG: insulinase family protein, partial [Cellulosilyticaceae bacterium]